MNRNFRRAAGNARTAEHLKKKLKSKSGESIAEVLITALVVALGALLLVVMVVASRNIIQKSEKAYNTYLNERNTMEAQDDADHTTDNQPADDSKEYKLVSKNAGRLQLKITENGNTQAVNIPSGITMDGADPDSSGVPAENTIFFYAVQEDSGADAKTVLISYEPAETGIKR